MSFQPILLDDSLDSWLAIETNPERRETVVRFLMALCDAEGRWDDASPVAGTRLRRSPPWSLEPASWSCG